MKPSRERVWSGQSRPALQERRGHHGRRLLLQVRPVPRVYRALHAVQLPRVPVHRALHAHQQLLRQGQRDLMLPESQRQLLQPQHDP